MKIQKKGRRQAKGQEEEDDDEYSDFGSASWLGDDYSDSQSVNSSLTSLSPTSRRRKTVASNGPATRNHSNEPPSTSKEHLPKVRLD